MNKNLYKIFLATLFLINIKCSNKDENLNNFSQFNLYGKVESLKEISYKTNSKQEKIKKEWVFVAQNDKHIIFDIKGNIKEERNYSSGGLMTSKKLFEYNDSGILTKLEYYYGSENLLLSYLTYENGNEKFGYSKKNNDSFIKSKEFIYDNKNNLVEVLNYENNIVSEKIIYYYDINNNLIRKDKFDSSNNLLGVNSYSYDLKNRKIEDNSTESNGYFEGKINYLYDDFDNLIEEKWFDKNNNLKSKTVFEYDIKGRKIEENHFNNKLENYWNIEYKYFFDKKGNIIKTILLIDGKPEYIIEREIKYFNEN